MNDIDLLIRNIEEAIVDGKRTLPNQPRWWLCKYGALDTSLAYIWCNKPEVKAHARQLRSIYTAMLDDTNKLIQPSIYTGG